MRTVEVITFKKDGGWPIDRAECEVSAVPLTASTLWDDATGAGVRVGQVGVYVEGKLFRMFTRPPFAGDLAGLAG